MANRTVTLEIPAQQFFDGFHAVKVAQAKSRREFLREVSAEFRAEEKADQEEYCWAEYSSL